MSATSSVVVLNSKSGNEEIINESSENREDSMTELYKKPEPKVNRPKTMLYWCPKAHKTIQEILNNKLYIAYMTVITIYVLFADDIRILACPKQLDDIFYAITTFSMINFFIEVVMESLAT